MFLGSALHRYYARVPSTGSSSSTTTPREGRSETAVASSSAFVEACSSDLGKSRDSKGMSVCNIPRRGRAKSEVVRRRSNPAVKLIEASNCMLVTTDSERETILASSDGVEVVFVSSNSSAIGSDLSTALPSLDKEPIAVKKCKRSYESSRRFQESWATKMPSAELHRGPDGLYETVLCLSCTSIRGQITTLAAKWDTLQKHAGKRKAKKDMPRIGVKEGQWFMDKNCKHARNERIWASRRSSTVIEQVCAVKGERARKRQQFATLLHLLHEGRLMAEYAALESLLTFLEVPKLPKKHWNATAGWQLVECMFTQVQCKIQQVIKQARFFSITCDEVTTLDNESWISVHGYTCEDFVRRPMLLALERILDKGGANHLTIVLISAIEKGGGISKQECVNKLASFGADGVNTFQGKRSRVVKQLQNRFAPRVMGIHCMAHRTNLAVEALSKLEVVSRIEAMLASLFRFFSKSPKRHREYQALAEHMNSKGLKILRNVKTRWISMLSPALRIMNEYNVLVVKFHQDSQAASVTNVLAYLTDVQILLGLACLLPMLRSLHSLIKFAQGRDLFVCDYVAPIHCCMEEVQAFYVDEAKSFEQDIFWDFKALLQTKHDHIPMTWKTTSEGLDLNSDGLEILHFTPTSHNIRAVYVAPNGKASHVTRDVYACIIHDVKVMCRGAALKLLKQLEARFPASSLMDAFGFVYPQYWQVPNAEENFEKHLAVIKEHYCYRKTFDIPTHEQTKSKGRVAEPVLNSSLLDEQKVMFKITMRANSELALKGELPMNPLTRLWRRLDASGLLRHKLSEYIKVTELAVVTVLGRVEDERTFSTLSFMKNKLRNWLSTHLPLVVGMHAQDFFDLSNFPYDTAYE
ncbi:hypothetical protein KC19_VG138700 [Ceratodon purpureus]|uniref:Uncharacterized protein n=1 Tax=Ceratodon purpureus TaxID=3225 RepID=A0A8T0HQA6_CERPU|nr:hypothetical protein KC19_VG138700 [Ceratodon purpureus]